MFGYQFTIVVHTNKRNVRKINFIKNRNYANNLGYLEKEQQAKKND